MDIKSSVRFSEKQALRTEKRASYDQREKEIANLNVLIGVTGVKLTHSVPLLSGHSTTLYATHPPQVQLPSKRKLLVSWVWEGT